MKSVLEQIKAQNMEKFYKITNISSKGVITVDNSNIVIYKVEPANIIACDENMKNKIYHAYMTCIRGMPDIFQIVICNSIESFEDQLNYYKGRLSKVNNNGLKQALISYIKYLEKLSEQSKFNKTKHYLIIKEAYGNDVKDTFNNLHQLGVYIEKVKSKAEAEKVLKAAIIKERSG